MEDRLLDGEHVVNLIVDTTACRIQAPSDDEVQYCYYDMYHGYHTIKYEIGCSIATGNICWLKGGFPGQYTDSQIVRASGVLENLKPGEHIMGDRFYYGVRCFVTPFRGYVGRRAEYVRAWDYYLSARRVLIERWNNRIKNFKAFSIAWRHPRALHHVAFKAAANIVCLYVHFHPLSVVCPPHPASLPADFPITEDVD